MVKISVDEIESIHNKIVERFKISSGTINKSTLEAIIERPDLQLEEQKDVYSDVFLKAAAILEGIIRWHPFADGNKRTALATAVYYLTLEGYATALPLSAVRYTVEIAENNDTDTVSTQKLIREIAIWFKEHSDRNQIMLLGKLTIYLGIPYYLLILLSKIGFKNYINQKVSYWMAFDMYPEYQKEASQIISFIQDTLNASLKVVFPKKEDDKENKNKS